ncbi:unnamed protein product [Camellia sinensis]
MFCSVLAGRTSLGYHNSPPLLFLILSTKSTRRLNNQKQFEPGFLEFGSMMDCNKEEAVRAKQIAENMMQRKDFVEARKFVLKAQRLYPDLENISQMIMVCDVHCSAENKVFGNEKDWYGILKIEPTADEASIKKQYRKFALLLHPDKNKFPGATDAFKLIGEAQRVLLDREKRMLHDSKCKASRPMAPNWGRQQASSNPNVVKQQPWVQNRFMGKPPSPFTSFTPQQQQPHAQTQPAFPNNRPTFWTVCPFCSVRYQFYREVVNKLLWCQNCKRSFTGYEAQATTSETNWTQPVFPKQENQTRGSVPKMGTSKVNPKKGSTSKVSKRRKQVSESSDDTGSSSDSEEDKVGKKRKQVAESSESCDTGNSSDSEEDIVIEEDGDVQAKQNFGCYGEYPRRSTRSKQNISYKENLSDDENLSDNDDLERPLKRGKCSGSFRAMEQEADDPLLKEEAPKMNEPDGYGVDIEGDVKEVKRKENAFHEGNLQNGKEETKKVNGDKKATEDGHKGTSAANGESPLNSIPNVATDPEIYEYPDPDFSDFDKDRKQECFAVGQTWAVYDTLDAMPRFYARIKKVFSPGFRLKITWLEPDPDDEDEIKWVEKGLPASCGNFKHGNTENTEDHPMFSHLILWEKGSRRDTYKIHPRKGETWALFKNWDIKWNSDPESRKYEFEFVEVLSDYTEGIGVSVAYLRKLRGFSCLFCRTVKDGTDSFQVPPNQLFRFSHRVPSFQMSGEERKDVPRGSFELDPACLPMNIEEIDAPQDLKVEPVTVSKENTSECHMNKNSQLDPEHISSDDGTEDPHEAFEIPDPEFYNFDDEKSAEKFETGQVWALYSDVDGLPKYYAQIKKIDRQPEFKLCIAWLAACPPPKNIVRWLDRDMLICCGRFKPKKGLSKEYTETGAFSHQLRAEHTDEKDVYAIFPKKGEVWALYKNWNAGITYSDLSSCEYDIVEILQENDVDIKVLFLEPVNGFKTVFKYQMKEGSSLTMKLPKKELLRFSHQIPFFRLTEERGGSLRGYWELDPAALPVAFFSSS